MAIRWTRKALEQLEATTACIARDNPARASAFVGEIRDKTEVRARFPAIGRPGRMPGTRELVVHENCVMPYRVKDGVVQILRVHHVARLWPQRF